MKTLTSKVATIAVAALLSLTATSARGDGFSTTNVQVLQGWNFHDNLLGYDTQSGTMTTVTLNHFSTWAYGDNFAFFDLYRGDFKNQSAQGRSDLYAEWHPRLFLNKVFGMGSLGFVRNWGLAGEINQARGFYAYMGGLGLDLDIPFFTVAGLNVYYRYDNFNQSTVQISPFWTVPFALGPVGLVFTGFVDVFWDANNNIDVMAQPELLLDVGAFWGAKNRVHVGCEWYVHHYTFLGETKTVSAPQAMVQWTIF